MSVMAEYDPEKIFGSLVDEIESRRMVFLGVILALLLVLIGSSGTPTTSVVFHENISLQYIEDNRIGRVFVQSNSPLISYYRTPDYRACIYTANRTPILLDVENQELFFFVGDQIKESNLSITLPEEKLGVDGLDENMNIELQKRCPLRSDQKIVVTAKR